MSDDNPWDKVPSLGIDWAKVEVEYRAGILSVYELASRYKVEAKAIKRRAHQLGWVRDIRRRIHSQAENLVAENAAPGRTERQVVEANARVVADVRLKHRDDIHRARKLCLDLLLELEGASVGKELLADIHNELSKKFADDDNAIKKQEKAYLKALSLAGRSSTLKILSDTLKNLINLEREAWGMEQEQAAGQNRKSFHDFTDEELEAFIGSAIADGSDTIPPVSGEGSNSIN